ncbi:hypothetical protein F442_16715 [Phytophthora nicotianae P10297]|uniref:Uncharacterized protein n=1 Tax=Phytophthora nicotianae P10297 TaxID=1317064 RepID=W2YJD8_PHYNI|nr:hypothetical protein F442_16715 [Phytophthora nicotianae P10297]
MVDKEPNARGGLHRQVAAEDAVEPESITNRARLKRSVSSGDTAIAGIKQKSQGSRKKRFSFVVANATMLSPDSSSDGSSEEEYTANSYGEHEDDVDYGISLELAQKEASLELAELTATANNPVQGLLEMVPDVPKFGGLTEAITGTKCTFADPCYTAK